MRHAYFLIAVLLAAGLPGHAIAKTSAPSIEQRLQRLEDESAIRQILLNYAGALDGRNTDAYVALFAKNGEWINGNLVRKGPDEIRALVGNMFRTTPPGFVNMESFELTFHPDISVTGDHATAKSEHILFKRATDGSGSPQAVLFGRYEDEFIREDGAWKILRRVDIPVMPTREEWLKIMRAKGAAQ